MSGVPPPPRRPRVALVRALLGLWLSALLGATALAEEDALPAVDSVATATVTTQPSRGTPLAREDVSGTAPQAAAAPGGTEPSAVPATAAAEAPPPTLPPLPTAATSEVALPQREATSPPAPADSPTPSPTPLQPTATASPSATATRPPASRTASPTPTRAEPLPPRPMAGAHGTGTRSTLLPFAGGALAVLLGLALGIAAAGIAAGARRRNSRRAAATALLAELRWIDAVLRKIADRGSSASDLSVDHPILEAGLGELALFEPETAGRIADLHYHLQGVAHEMQRYRDNPKAWAGRLPEIDRLLRHRAVTACRLIPELGKGLQRAGGSLPPPIAGGEQAQRDDGLPPTPFGDGESDDWTL